MLLPFVIFLLFIGLAWPIIFIAHHQTSFHFGLLYRQEEINLPSTLHTLPNKSSFDCSQISFETSLHLLCTSMVKKSSSRLWRCVTYLTSLFHSSILSLVHSSFCRLHPLMSLILFFVILVSTYDAVTNMRLRQNKILESINGHVPSCQSSWVNPYSIR